MYLRGLPLILLVFLLAACSSRPTAAPPVAARPPAIALTDPATACFAALDQRHVGYDRLADFHTEDGCGIDEALRLKAPPIALNRPLLLSCPTAISVSDFESRVVIPAARTALGKTVKTIASAGSYDCRGQRSDHPERLSEHALGRAIDITGFMLEDGTRITILKDWWGKDDKAKFLHQVAMGACKLFSVVLTPKSNRLHRDHLHLDTGPYKKCDA